MRYYINNQPVGMIDFSKALRDLYPNKGPQEFRTIWIGMHRPGCAAEYIKTYLPNGMAIVPVVPATH